MARRGDEESKKDDRTDFDKRLKASHKFVMALALVSIVSFIGIVSETLFDYNINSYVEGLWMFIIGVGLIFEGKITTLRNIKIEGLTPRNFTHLITIVVGAIAVMAGLFSFPQLRIVNSGFLAVKGIISLIAIVIIVIQTWIIK